MYLSRLVLNPRSKHVRGDLADCQALHRTVLSAFPDLPEKANARACVGALHRVDVDPRTGVATLLVQSRAEPHWTRLPQGYLLDAGGGETNPSVKPVGAVYEAIQAGMLLRFRLRANPTRKIDAKSGPDGQRRNGKRVELRSEEAQLVWLKRKAEEGGFRVLSVAVAGNVPDVRARQEPKAHGFRADETGSRRRLTYAAATFDGRLRVEDPVKLRASLENGCGSAKAYGFGLLSLGPVETT